MITPSRLPMRFELKIRLFLAESAQFESKPAYMCTESPKGGGIVEPYSSAAVVHVKEQLGL